MLERIYLTEVYLVHKVKTAGTCILGAAQNMEQPNSYETGKGSA